MCVYLLVVVVVEVGVDSGGLALGRGVDSLGGHGGRGHEVGGVVVVAVVIRQHAACSKEIYRYRYIVDIL